MPSVASKHSAERAGMVHTQLPEGAGLCNYHVGNDTFGVTEGRKYLANLKWSELTFVDIQPLRTDHLLFTTHNSLLKTCSHHYGSNSLEPEKQCFPVMHHFKFS